MTPEELYKTQLRIINRWKQHKYSEAVSILRNVPEEYAMEMLLVCSDSVDDFEKVALLHSLGFIDVMQSGDVYQLLNL